MLYGLLNHDIALQRLDVPLLHLLCQIIFFFAPSYVSTRLHILEPAHAAQHRAGLTRCKELVGRGIVFLAQFFFQCDVPFVFFLFRSDY